MFSRRNKLYLIRLTTLTTEIKLNEKEYSNNFELLAIAKRLSEIKIVRFNP